MDATEVLQWSDGLDDVAERIAGCFPRSELPSRAAAYLRGLLGRVHRKTVGRWPSTRARRGHADSSVCWAGRIENCQVGVFLALAGSRGRALIDPALHLHRAWCCDRQRCREAGVMEAIRLVMRPFRRT